MPDSTTHPSEDQLSAYNLGQLSPRELAIIESHVNECRTCCETIIGLSTDDTFLELLQEAGRSSPDQEFADQTVAHDVISTAAAAEIPTSLAEHPRYQVVELIGKGGMGDVFKAQHRMMERTVALKIINRQLMRKSEAVDRFRREVKAAAQLSHPNIVTAYDAEQTDNVHYLVMEFVDGIDLSQVVKQQGALAIRDACDYVRQAALGLQHAHERGMVHRDIKPHNLMVATDGTLKILDFGLASLTTEAVVETSDTVAARGDLTAVGAIMGTPDFISPEQAQDARQADIRSDIYSLGTTLYFLLTGQAPFTGGSVMQKLKSHAQAEPEPLQSRREGVSDDLSAVVAKMIAKDPDQRFQTPAEVASALSPFSSESLAADSSVESSKEASVATSTEAHPQVTMGTLRWGALAACLCVTIGIGGFLLFQNVARQQRMEAAAAQLRTYLQTGESDQTSLNALDILLSHSAGSDYLRGLDDRFDTLAFIDRDLPQNLVSAALLLHDDRVGSSQPELTVRKVGRNFTGGRSIKLPMQLRVDSVETLVGAEQQIRIRYFASTESQHRSTVAAAMRLSPGAEYAVTLSTAEVLEDRVDWDAVWRDGVPTGKVAENVRTSAESLQPKARLAVQVIKSLMLELEKHKLLQARYPTRDEGLRSMSANFKVPGRATRKETVDFFLIDPWGRPYNDQVPGKHGAKPDVWSAGPDGKTGNSDDLCSWKLPADAFTARPSIQVVKYEPQTGEEHRWKLLAQDVGEVRVRLLRISAGEITIASESQLQGSGEQQSTIDLNLTLKESANKNTVFPSVGIAADGLQLSRSTASEVALSGPFQASPVVTRGKLSADNPTVLFHRCAWKGNLTYQHTLASMSEASKQGANFLALTLEWTPIEKSGQVLRPDTRQKDIASLQGEWQITYVEEGGRVVPNELVQQLRYVFAEDTLTMIVGNERQKTTFKLNPSALLKAIDIVEDGKKKYGIYELDGETLKICWEKGNDQFRPTAFVSEPNAVNNTMIILKRIGPGTVADRNASYAGERLTIKDVTRNAAGKVEIAFNTMPETVWYCPGANATAQGDAIELTFVRASFRSKPTVDFPVASVSRRQGSQMLVVDAKGKPIYLREGENRRLIWSPDNANILGAWRVTYSEDGGRVVPRESLKKIRISFSEDTMAMDMAGRQSKSTYQLNPTTAPKSIDVTANGRTKFGIYDLEGDTLRICFAEHTEQRPTTFDSQPDSVNDLILLMKRITKVGGK